MIYFRVDMNSEIAMGHLMRCLSIADSLRDLNEEVTFITADENPVSLLKQRGYEYIVLDSKWNDLENELKQLIDLIKEKEIKVLLIDHYYVTEKYLEELRKYTYLVYIDDVNSFIYPVDLLICYDNFYELFEYEKNYINTDTKFLLGTKYTPLRKAFQNIKAKEIKENIENILIMSGGSDPYHFVSNMIEKINFNVNIYAICGGFNLDYEVLKDRYKDKENINILKSVNNIEDYMKNCDLTISGAGSTLYELCSVGTPTISFSFVDNQIKNAEFFDKENIILYAGDIRKDNVYENIISLIDNKMNNYLYRKNQSKKMVDYIDGKGALRIAKELIKVDSEKGN